MIELERKRAENLNRFAGNLTGYDCPDCMNRGFFHRVDDQGRRYLEECKCMAVRRSRERIMRSGLVDLMKRYTFKTWQVREPWQKSAAETVKRFIERPEGWLLAAGRPGTGKTHLCTCACTGLIKKGIETRYALWRDMSVQAKAVVNDEEEYRRLVEPLKRVPCLYIDDLFKTGKGQPPTTGDVNLAFEIINSRYNDSKKITVISTELDVGKLLAIDEATGSRIYERSKNFYLDLTEKKNWRLVG